MTIDSMRRSYGSGGIDVNNVSDDPVDQFHVWFKAAHEQSPGDWFEANAMTLATSDRAGRVSARIVLLKGFDAGCPMFYTNYQSDKGLQLAENPHAALCFYWPHMEQQVRIEGGVEKVSAELSDKYFHSRPRGSQIGAVVSEQSRVVDSRETLDQQLREAEARFADQKVPRPEHWGGYRLQALRFEFWKGGEHRLHDRIIYRRESLDAPWVRERLAP